MKNVILMVVCCVVVALFTACGANVYGVRYASNPPGASVVCDGHFEGYAPVNIFYDLDKIRQNPYASMPNCEAIWASGVKVQGLRNPSEDTWSEVLEKFPTGVTYTLQRPDVPGLEKDMEFALKVQQLKQQESQMQANQYYQNQQLLNQQQQLINQSKGLKQQQDQHDEVMDYLRFGM